MDRSTAGIKMIGKVYMLHGIVQIIFNRILIPEEKSALIRQMSDYKDEYNDEWNVSTVSPPFSADEFKMLHAGMQEILDTFK